MGLPLWQPSVESDIPSRPEAKNPVAHARSRVRSTSTRDRGTTAMRERAAVRNAELRNRERRRGLLQEMLGSSRDNAPQIPDPPSRPVGGLSLQSDGLRALLARPRLESNGENGEPVRHFGDAPGLDDRIDRLRRLRLGVENAANARRNLRDVEGLVDAQIERLERRRRARETPARVDGLGDRNRSLSPENDNVWDTLLTTVTPDPQPPSAGSSFSSMRSAVTRAGLSDGMNGSSGTSLTGPETGAEEAPALEQVCDSDDEDDRVAFELEFGDQTSAPSWFSDGPGSYADVARLGESSDRLPAGLPGALARRFPGRPPQDYHGDNMQAAAYRTSIDRPDAATDEIILQLVGGLGGMQHIVRNLVRREDIPNDWWVDAGLSRSLPRDGSAEDESATTVLPPVIWGTTTPRTSED